MIFHCAGRLASMFAAFAAGLPGRAAAALEKSFVESRAPKAEAPARALQMETVLQK